MDHNMSLRSIPLTVTTRGIGITVANIVKESRQQRFKDHNYDSSSDDDDYIPRLFDEHPSIYALYRACLALLESKLKLVSFTPFPTTCKNKYVNNNLIEYFDMTSLFHKVPSPIARIINDIGVVRCGDRVYHPVVAAPVYYDNGKLMPRSENVLLSTLRQTVQALADPDTPEHDRIRFKDTCPIPGAIWNDDNTLNNPDEIIPHDYKTHRALEDLNALSFYVDHYIRNKYLSEKPLETSLNGRKSLLVSCRLIDIKMKPRKQGESPVDYYKRCDYYQNTNEFDISSPESLSYQDQLQGAHNLLGEIPEFDDQYVIYYPRYRINHTYVFEYLRCDMTPISEMITKNNTQNELNMRQRSIPLTITSRAIGFSVAQFIKEFNITRYQRRYPDIEIPEHFIYLLYRVCLGLFELKLNGNRSTGAPPSVFSYKEKFVIPFYLSSRDLFGSLPNSIMNIVNGIRVVKHEGRVYHPVVAAPVYYDKGKLLPRSENVLLSTLRQTVQALADPDTPEHDRVRFKDTCPIPGAIWNDDNTLNNPDEIIPHNYTLTNSTGISNFREDIAQITEFLNRIHRIYNIMLVSIKEDTTMDDNISMLLSNVLLKMQVSPRHKGEPIEEYLNRCRVEGDMNGHFTSPEHMNETQQIKGLLQLFGEVPTDYKTYYRHIYNAREQVCHPYGVQIDTQYDNLHVYYKRLEERNNNEMANVEGRRGTTARGKRWRGRGRGRGFRNQHSQ